MTQEPRRPRLFICHSHEDDPKYLDGLLKNFKTAKIQAWSDRDIPHDEKWDAEIRKAIAECDCALCLVSPNFFVSDYITDTEWPALLEEEKNRGISIFWAHVRDSIYKAHEVALRQCLHNPKEPLESLDPPGLSTQLRNICERVQKTLGGKRVIQGSKASNSLLILATLDLGPADLQGLLCDDLGRVWYFGGHAVNCRDLPRQASQEWGLGSSVVKAGQAARWRGGLILADWQGGLWLFQPGEKKPRALVQAREDSLPIHLLAEHRQGQALVAADWSGQVYQLRENGQDLGLEPWLRCPDLPARLLPLAGGGLGVVSRGGRLEVYDQEGSPVWARQLEQEAADIWPLDEESGVSFLMLGGDGSLARLDAKRLDYLYGRDKPPMALHARGQGGGEGGWLALVNQSHQLLWLREDALGEPAASPLELDFQPRQIVAVKNAWNPHSQMLLGLDQEGRVFSVKDNSLQFYDQPGGVKRLGLDPSHLLLTLERERDLLVARNPCLPRARFQVDLEACQGRLKVGEYRLLNLRLINHGPYAIFGARPLLHGNEELATGMAVERAPAPVRPGQPFEVGLTVKAHSPGTLALSLELELDDVAGPAQTSDRLTFIVEADPA